MKLPALRPVDAFPLRQRGKAFVALRDPEGYSGRLVLLTPEEWAAAEALDGRATREDLLRRAKGLDAGALDYLLAVLDNNLLLDSPRFREREEELLGEFRRARVREAVYAGVSYPKEPRALRRELEACYAPPDGPGLAKRAAPPGRLVGLVAPHIDFPRGGPAYAWAYREVLDAELADLYVLLGVAHHSPPTPFVGTLKDYATPLGSAATDRTLMEALAAKAGFDLFADEGVHRREHSLEFQAVFLRHAAGIAGGAFKVLPLLCSAGGRARAPRLLKELAALLRGYDGSVCLLAGVDLAHVGTRFGDEEDLSPELLRRVEQDDRASLERVLAKDPEGFEASVRGKNAWRRVCGGYALQAFAWLMKELHPEAEGSLLAYGGAPDPAGGQVTFASMAFRA